MGLVDFSLGDVGNVFTSIREAVTGEKLSDPNEMAKVNLQLQQLEAAAKGGQLTINAAEAKSPHLFVAGWRPAIGWVGAAAIAYQFLLYPLVVWAWVYSGRTLESAPPMIDASALYPIILGMLGIGAMRTVDKIKKVDTKKTS